MAEESNYELSISRDNWRVLGIVLMSLISAIILVIVSSFLGRLTLLNDIRSSGYDVQEIDTCTNTYYIIEKIK